MNYIKRGQDNFILLTLTELTDNVENCTIEFVNEFDPNVKRKMILQNDISPTPDRINAFRIEEKMDVEDNSINKISLNIEGYYSYVVKSRVGDVIEKGRCVVVNDINTTINSVYL